MNSARKQAAVLLAIVTAVSLWVGINVGVGFGNTLWFPPPETTPTGPTFLPTATPAVSPTPAVSQISLIVLAVDAVASLNPQLEAYWLITFKPDTPEYYLLGVPPTTTVTLSEAEPQTLRAIHLIDVRYNLNDLFVREAARVLSPGANRPKAVVTFDRAMVAQAIELLDGLDIAGHHYSGEAALAAYDALPPDSAERLERQAAILLGLLREAGDRGLTPTELLALLTLGQTWYPDYESVQALAHAAPAFQASEPSFQHDQFIPFLFDKPSAP